MSIDFNTSHVSINHNVLHSVYPLIKISIHLMFLLIRQLYHSHLPTFLDFNTSHVSINQGNNIPTNNNKLFQYISCFY